MLKRLRVKFVCINMVIVTAMLCVIFALVLNFTRSDLESRSIQMLQAIAAGSLQPPPPGEKPGQVPLPHFTVQISPQGEVTASGDGYYDLSDKQLLAELVEAALSSRQTTGVIAEYDLRYYRVATPVSQHIVFADMSLEVSTLRGLLQTCLLIGLIAFAAFMLVSLILARWAVKPVERAWEQQRRFVADASHELKTPLTVITTNAELLQSPACTEEDRAQFSGNILTMSHQMRGLTESLLELARVDNGAAGMRFSDVDLSQLVNNAVLPFEAVFFEKGLSFDSLIQEGVHVRASEGHIRQVVEILLDNAQKYARSGGGVLLRLEKAGRTECVLSVANAGDPISKEDLKNIFKRFYRVDPARGMNHSYGLGLSIAQTIVRAHRGRIWAESGGGINTFFVQLPAL